MSKRVKRTAVAVDDAANDAAATGNDGNIDGATSSVATAPGITDAAIDPSSIAATDEPIPEQPARRGRGRPPGTGNSRKAQTIPLNVSGLEKLLVGIHGGLAILSSRPEWMLDTDAKIFDGKTEAEFLAASIKDVASHYGAGMFDQKTLDWLNLGQCLATVYVGRIYAIRSTPRVRTAAPSGPPAGRAGSPPVMHRTPEPVNDFSPRPPGGTPKANVGSIAGLGEIEFPADHPLNPNGKPN